MDDLKSDTNVKHEEWDVVRYIFYAMYGSKCLLSFTKVFDFMDESVCFHG
jgi:hypothetical protein